MEALTCSQASAQAGEQLFGSASEVQTWLLLEVNEIFTAKALVNNRLPEEVNSYLGAQQKSIPGSRLLFIQQERDRDPSSQHFFIASSAGRKPVLLEYTLSDYRDLLDMDISGLAASASEQAYALRSEPLYLVCTNGKRDPCCAAHGAPFYRNLAALEPVNTWQSTHVSGHRFAANAIYLPYGIYFGRLRAGQEDEFLLACREGRLLVDHYRGRAIYPAHVQAAEYFLYKQQPDLRLDSLDLDEIEESVPLTWKVQFRRRQSNEIYSIRLSAEQSEFEVLESCGKEAGRQTQYRLLESEGTQ